MRYGEKNRLKKKEPNGDNNRSVGAEIYGTDVCGTITVTTDGTDYKVSGCTP